MFTVTQNGLSFFTGTHHKHTLLLLRQGYEQTSNGEIFRGSGICMLRCSDVIDCCRAKKENFLKGDGTDHICTGFFSDDAFLSGCPSGGTGCSGVDVSWPRFLFLLSPGEGS